MMQDVATAKSDIAAFATGLGISPAPKLESNQDFAQFLQDQNAQHTSLKQPAEKPQTKQQNNQASVKTHTEKSLPDDKNATAKIATSDTAQKNEGNDNDESIKAQASAAPTENHNDLDSNKNAALASNNQKDVIEPDGQNPTNDRVQGSEVSLITSDIKNGMAELTLDLDQQKSISELNPLVTPEVVEDNFVTEEWVALVEAYQRLANLAQASEKLPSEEQPIITKHVEVPPSFIDTELLASITPNNDTFSGNISVKAPETTDSDVSVKATETKDSKTQNNSNPIALVSPKIASLVQQAMTSLSAADQPSVLTSDKIQQLTSDMLMADPESLKTLQKALENVSQKAGVDVTESKDMVKANSELLQSLISNKETSVVAEETQVNLDTKALRVPGLSNIQEVVIENTKSGLKFADLVAASNVNNQVQAELELESSQVSQELIAPVLVRNVNDKSKQINDLGLLLALPDKKLSKVLEHIAAQILPNTRSADVATSDSDISQLATQIATPKNTDFALATDHPAKDFIAALKSGIAEFKSQVAQGREPGIDLKAMITDAVAKSNEGQAMKAPVNIEQVAQSVSQVLDFAQSINRAIEHQQQQAFSAVQRDVAQIQGEQSKSLQFNQFEAKFEKAVNITKPEGHQQLAEKVRWMVNTKNLVADIRLDPAELGSVHVKVAMSGESATVNFVVQSQHARDAMDNATPRLREMLAEKGIELGQSSVEQENQGQSSQGEGELSQSNQQGQELDSTIDSTEQVIAQQSIVNGALGGIDYFV